jgi:hypothetical protein
MKTEVKLSADNKSWDVVKPNGEIKTFAFIADAVARKFELKAQRPIRKQTTQDPHNGQRHSASMAGRRY